MDSVSISFFKEQYRLEGVKNNIWVDEVFILDEEVNDYLIKKKPDIVVKGREYENKFNLESEIIKKYGGKLIQISTDYVFNGEKSSEYNINDIQSPINIYGKSKYLAEKTIADILQDKNQLMIIRTSWLISPYGKNFVLTMLRLFNQKKKIQVVADQIGCPTSTFGLSELCWRIVNLKNQDLIFKNNKNGILHWSDENRRIG